MKKFILLLTCFFSHLMMAQDPFYINYGTDDGLPSSTVYSVFRDEKDFLWFTTDAGVAKYDSHSFTLYNTDNGLSDNEVFQMKKDLKGRIWFLTLNGIPAFMYNGKIYNQTNSDLVRKLASTSLMMDFYEDSNNNCYFAYRSGEVAILKPNDEVEMKHFLTSFCGVWKSKNMIYYLMEKGVYDANGKKRFALHSTNSVSRAYHVGKRNFFSNMNCLYEVGTDGQIAEIFKLPSQSEIINIYIDNGNKMWLCTRNGVFLVMGNTIKNKFFDTHSITAMTRDFEGGYWLTTLKNGILYVPSFDVFQDRLNTTDLLKLNCMGISDKGDIWVGSNQNDYYVKKANGNFAHHELTKIKRNVIAINQRAEICNIRFFNNDTYIVSKVCLARIKPDNPIHYFEYGMNDFLIDDNYYYLACGEAYKIPKIKFENIPAMQVSPYALINKRATVFAKGDENTVWIGTNFGLYNHNSAVNTCVYLGDKYEKLKANITNLFYDDANHSLFAATSSQGILEVKDNRIVNQFHKKNGLNSNTCNAIRKITDNYYLVGSNNGLNSLTLKGNSFETKNLNAILGLKNKKVSDIGFFNNTVYLVTDNALLYFDIKNIDQTKTYPVCHIESLKSHERNIENTTSHTFSYDNNDISINYIGISYIDQNLTYFYKLYGRSGRWTSSKETQINYQSLASGKYCFQVYCANGFGVKSQMKMITFEILTPFWQETWFVVLIILLFLLAVYWFIRHRLELQQKHFEKEKVIIQTERDKANLEKQMIDLEQKALRLQMNPHFIFNALNTIKGYYSEGNTIKASSYISKFSKLLRMLLENTEQAIPLASEIEMLELYIDLAKTRYKNKFEYEIIVDGQLNRNETAIPTLLLQPIVENAIIHGLAPKEETGLLQVSFLKKGQQLECIIEDNGIGREASKTSQTNKEYQSKAIEITMERIALFGENTDQSSFEIIDLKNNSVAAGTKVIITIPLISIW